MSSGIQDYLLKPLNPDTLREAFLGAQAALVAPRAHDADADRPRMATAVIGVRGGVGGSTVASSLARQIGRATSELQSLMRISYAVFCLKKKTRQPYNTSM